MVWESACEGIGRVEGIGIDLGVTVIVFLNFKGCGKFAYVKGGTVFKRELIDTVFHSNIFFGHI